MRVLACVSDVQLGYGSPQIPALVRHAAARYGARAAVVEPRDPGSGRRAVAFDGIETVPVEVRGPYTPEGRKKYNEGAAAAVDRLEPDVLVVCTTYSLPSLFALKKRPATVLYYYLEVASVYGSSDAEMNSGLEGKVDGIIFTEENRAVHFGGAFGFGGVPFCVIYNCVNGPEPAPDRERNGRIMYAGTIRQDAMADCLVGLRAPVDVWGSAGAYAGRLERMGGGAEYRGHAEASEIARLRPRYSYSLVMWRPDNENTRWASPNKLFESVAAGVPPISTPNPQAETLLSRYGCGMLTRGYECADLSEQVSLALSRCGTGRYEGMVRGCARAVRAELNWPAQMAKLDRMLDRLGAPTEPV